MLGVRLGEEVERRFERFVHARGLGKSEVARTAIVEYMDRHGLDPEFERQLQVTAQVERNDPTIQADLKELDGLAWRTIESS